LVFRVKSEDLFFGETTIFRENAYLFQIPGHFYKNKIVLICL